jgi:bacteriophage N4 adsorption protein B
MWGILSFVTNELALFAGVGFLIGGVDELLIDVIWLGRTFWRRMTIYKRHPRANSLSLACPAGNRQMAVFIPAWDESSVIGDMLAHGMKVWNNSNVRVFVGTYPNDLLTAQAVRSVNDPRITLVTGEMAGPTTKAACLNDLWQAMVDDEQARGFTYAAVILHDAEDVVHPAEISVFERLIDRFDLIQLPVTPLLNARSRWIAGHYADEFAEAHGKALVVREALGAGLPAAGVGCAFSRRILEEIARNRGGMPFDETSLTEDYELGLTIKMAGGKSALIRLPESDGTGLVAVRAYFPDTLESSVRQKSRWMTGIALQGWDRMGWTGGLAERWMRLRDRRALIAAIILMSAYLGLILSSIMVAGHLLFHQPLPIVSTALGALLLANAILLLWRVGMRYAFVSKCYTKREGLRSIPRMVIANLIAIMAARRALGQYLLARQDGVVRWDKTGHAFPEEFAAR